MNRARFPKEKHQNSQKMGEIHELFVLALSLVWFAGVTPEKKLGWVPQEQVLLNNFRVSRVLVLVDPRRWPGVSQTMCLPLAVFRCCPSTVSRTV